MQEVPFDELPLDGGDIRREIAREYVTLWRGDVICGIGTYNVGAGFAGEQIISAHGTLLIWSQDFEIVDLAMPQYYSIMEFGRRSTPWITLRSDKQIMTFMSLHASVKRAAELVPLILREMDSFEERHIIALGDFNMGPQAIVDAANDLSPPSDNDGSGIALSERLALHVFPGFTHVDKANDNHAYHIDHILASANVRLADLRIDGIDQKRRLCTLAGHDHGIIRANMCLIDNIVHCPPIDDCQNEL